MTPRTISRRYGLTTPMRSIRIQRWMGIMVVGVVLLFILINRHGLAPLYRLQQDNERLNREIAALRARADSLRTEQASLESDMLYIERLARGKYRMVKRGEKVFRVLPDRKLRRPDNRDPAP